MVDFKLDPLASAKEQAAPICLTGTLNSVEQHGLTSVEQSLSSLLADIVQLLQPSEAQLS